MRQQVNLYRSEFSRTLPFPDFWRSLQVLGAVAGLLLLVLAWQAFRLSQGAGDLDDITAKTSEVSAKLAALQAKLPANRMQPVEQQIVDLNDELMRLREIRVLMAGQRLGGNLPGNQRGFSNQFEGLSRQYITGISLSQVKLLEGGRRIELEGFASPPEQAPRYLSGLHGDQAFNDVKFGQLTMQRQPENGHMAFQVKREQGEE